MMAFWVLTSIGQVCSDISEELAAYIFMVTTWFRWMPKQLGGKTLMII
jgi:hypothetical protein